jgi:phosphomannomutase
MPKHLFFDMDDTLTRSKSPMSAAHESLFRSLCEKKDVIVVSGQDESNIRRQITAQFDGSYYLLTQNGNHAINKDGSVLWHETFSLEQKEAIHTFIEQIRRELDLKVKDENDIVEDRGSQISYSLIGHHENVDVKRAFDSGAIKRIALLKSHESDVEELHAVGVEVAAAGTTCFDFMMLGKNKGFNVVRFIDMRKWKKDDSMYIGDALEPGRNDESVIGVIPTHAVKGPDDTFIFIKQMVD